MREVKNRCCSNCRYSAIKKVTAITYPTGFTDGNGRANMCVQRVELDIHSKCVKYGHRLYNRYNTVCDSWEDSKVPKSFRQIEDES